MEEDIVDEINDVEPRVVQLDDAQMCVKDVLKFMANQGSKLFSAGELLAMERIHFKSHQNWCCALNININKAM